MKNKVMRVAKWWRRLISRRISRRGILAVALVSLCAASVAVGFLWSWAWPCSLMGLMATLTLLRKSESLSTKRFLWLCLLYGYVFFGIVLHWIYKIKTTELIGDAWFAFLFLWLTYLLLVGSLAVGFLLFGILYRHLKVSVDNKTILLIPVIWIIAEYCRSFFFSVFSLGDGGSIGAYWNFGTLGFLASQTPLAYAGRLVGLYGLSFLVMAIVVAICQILQRQYRYVLILAIPLSLTVAGWSLYSGSDGATISAAVVSLGSETDRNYGKDLDKQIVQLPELDVLVLPEYSNYLIDTEGNAVDQLPPDNTKLLIDSSGARGGGEVDNILHFYSQKGKVLNSQQKTFLIPGGEYVPYLYHIILYYSGNKSLVHEFHQKNAVNRGSQPEQPFTYREVSYGALVCSGAIAPQLYTQLVAQGAEVLTNSASIATLGVSEGYYRQAYQMAVFTATANARPFLQSARGGPSYILDKDGSLQGNAVRSNSIDTLHTTVVTNRHKTLYTIWGEWVLMLSTVAVGISILLSYKRNRRARLKP